MKAGARAMADALEEAGCTSADILEHCRGPGPHVRGCWVVDGILGRFVGASADPTGWVRRVAVRSTMRSWRRTIARLAPGRRRGALVDGGEPRTRVALAALGRLPDAERRAVVLVDMAGVPVVEVAALEQVPPGTVAARLSRARRVVGDALADVVPATPVSIGPYGHGGRW